MASFAVSNKTIDKHFRYLFNLDNNSKKRLITKLNDSLASNKEVVFDLKSIFGAWDDKRDSYDIINEIRESRINHRDIEGF